jgi:hypothetical protein
MVMSVLGLTHPASLLAISSPGIRNRPGIVHEKRMPGIEQRRQKEEVTATSRALKKAARRERKKEIEEHE